MQVQPLASRSGLRIRSCCELWCRSQMQLGSGIALAVAWDNGYSSDSTPSLGTFICHRYSHPPPKKRLKRFFSAESNDELQPWNCTPSSAGSYRVKLRHPSSEPHLFPPPQNGDKSSTISRSDSKDQVRSSAWGKHRHSIS